MPVIPTPNSYPAGDVVRLSCVFSVSGTNTDPTTITLSVKDPTSAITAYVYGSSAMVRDAAGAYHFDLTISISGNYFYRYVGTGTVVAASEGQIISGPSNFV